MANFLTLIQDFCGKWGLPNLGGVVGSTEATARQLFSLTHEVTEAMQQYRWQNQRVRRQWTGTVGEDQGFLATLFPGYFALVPKTFWNNTQRRPIIGPISDTEYQAVKGLQLGGTWYRFRVAEQKLWVVPALSATDTLSVIYASTYTVLDASSSLKERVTADNDSFTFPDIVFKSQLEWRWLKQKGEPWLASSQMAENLVAANLNKDDALPTLHLDSDMGQAVRPGIVVPDGNWNV